MDLGEIGWGCRVDSIGYGYGQWRAVVNALMSLRILAPKSKLVQECGDRAKSVLPVDIRFMEITTEPLKLEM
jgi:hypothetical protein